MPSHSEIRTLPYSAKQMYDLVADVASYPKFLPWTSAARIRSRVPAPEGELMEADLIVSFKLFREKFGSSVLLHDSGRQIDTKYLDGPFKYMTSTWLFKDRETGGCDVNFDVDFEFKNALLAGAMGLVFNEAMQRVVQAFENRAAELYA